jgi:hypothetical protein
MKKLWLLLMVMLVTGCAHLPTVGAGAAMTTAATLDLQSTFACKGCIERNPLAAMLHNPEEPAWLYAGNYAVIGGLTAWTAHLRRRRSPLWWVPSAIVTGAYLFSWQHNLGVIRQLNR